MVYNGLAAERVCPVEQFDEGALPRAGLAHEHEHGDVREWLGGPGVRGRFGGPDALGDRGAVDEETQQEKPEEAEAADTPCPPPPLPQLRCRRFYGAGGWGQHGLGGAGGRG